MTVRPTPSGQTPRPNISRTGRSESTGAQRRPSEPSPQPLRDAPTDEVSISSEARQLHEANPARDAAPALSPDRLRQVLSRMTDGHYDRPEVRDAVVRKLQKDL